MRWTLIGVAVVLVGGVTVFFLFAPGIVESSMNQVVEADLPEVEPETQALHESLRIVDMHSDTLMWDRDLLKRSDRGHMDLPRLQDGNVAVQVFSSVSKSPKGQNYDANTDETDNITLLTIAQLQPPRTWRSLLQRSLYHAERLEQAAADSDGRLVMIRAKGDVDALLAARTRGEQVTGGLFSVEGLHNLEGDFGNVAVLYDAGMRMAGFTHFFDNEVAGSMHGVEKGPLTDLGRQVFDELGRRGISWTSPTPAIRPSPRCWSGQPSRWCPATEECRPLAMSTATSLTRRSAGSPRLGTRGHRLLGRRDRELTPAAVVDAIEHVIEVGGIETAALGSDYDGATTVAWDTSQFAVVTQELRSRGHSDADIAAIMGGNTLRVMREVLPR